MAQVAVQRLLLLLLVVPRRAALLPLRRRPRRRRKKRVRSLILDFLVHVKKDGILTRLLLIEKEESDEDMGFGLFD